MPRAVPDTNVWVSALLWGGNPAAVLKAAEEGRVAVFVSGEIVGEISKVLECPKRARICRAAGLRRGDLVEAVIRAARFVEPARKVSAVGDLPADDKFIECALAAGARCVVSVDRHLLEVASHGKIRILPAGDFLLAPDARA